MILHPPKPLGEAPVVLTILHVTSARRFPPPWSVEETDACFIVKDHAGLPLAYVGYLFDEPPTETARSNSC